MVEDIVEAVGEQVDIIETRKRWVIIRSCTTAAFLELQRDKGSTQYHTEVFTSLSTPEPQTRTVLNASFCPKPHSPWGQNRQFIGFHHV